MDNAVDVELKAVLYLIRLPNGEREREVIPRDIQEALDKVKQNFHDLEGTIRQQKLYLTSLTLQQVSINPVNRHLYVF